MQKKPYAPPKLTDHGSVVKQTKGMGADAYETMGRDVWEMNSLGVKSGFTKPVQEK